MVHPKASSAGLIPVGLIFRTHLHYLCQWLPIKLLETNSDAARYSYIISGCSVKIFPVNLVNKKFYCIDRYTVQLLGYRPMYCILLIIINYFN